MHLERLLAMVFLLGLILNIVLSISAFNDETGNYVLRPTGLSCASYIMINGNMTGTCRYPDLFSDTDGRCVPFYDVNCNNRPEPISPCDYPNTKCSKGYNKARLCTCPWIEDLNYEACRHLSNGFYPWPGRKWSPFYIECKDRHTLPTMCSGASVIFNFLDRSCQIIYSVVNEAYAMSLKQDIPTSLLYMLQGSYTDVPISTHDISNIKPTIYQAFHKSTVQFINLISTSQNNHSYLQPSNSFGTLSNNFGSKRTSTPHYFGQPYYPHKSIRKYYESQMDSSTKYVDTNAYIHIYSHSPERHFNTEATMNVSSTKSWISSSSYSVNSRNHSMSIASINMQNTFVGKTYQTQGSDEILTHQSSDITIPVSANNFQALRAESTVWSLFPTTSLKSDYLRPISSSEMATEIQRSTLPTSLVQQFTTNRIGPNTKSVEKDIYENESHWSTIGYTINKSSKSQIKATPVKHSVYQTTLEDFSERYRITANSTFGSTTSAHVTSVLHPSYTHASETIGKNFSTSETERFVDSTTQLDTISGAVLLTSPLHMLNTYISDTSYLNMNQPHLHDASSKTEHIVFSSIKPAAAQEATYPLRDYQSGDKNQSKYKVDWSTAMLASSLEVHPSCMFSSVPTIASGRTSVNGIPVALSVQHAQFLLTQNSLDYQKWFLNTDSLNRSFTKTVLPINIPGTLYELPLRLTSVFKATSSISPVTSSQSLQIKHVVTDFISPKLDVPSHDTLLVKSMNMSLDLSLGFQTSATGLTISKSSIKSVMSLNMSGSSIPNKTLINTPEMLQTFPKYLHMSPSNISDFKEQNTPIQVSNDSTAVPLFQSARPPTSKHLKSSVVQTPIYSQYPKKLPFVPIPASNSYFISATVSFATPIYHASINTLSVIRPSPLPVLTYSLYPHPVSLNSLGNRSQLEPNGPLTEISNSKTSKSLIIPLSAGIISGVLILVAVIVVIIILIKRRNRNRDILTSGEFTAHL